MQERTQKFRFWLLWDGLFLAACSSMFSPFLLAVTPALFTRRQQ